VSFGACCVGTLFVGLTNVKSTVKNIPIPWRYF
jgi:hypothetical protein